MRTLCLIFLSVQLSSASVIYTLTRSSDSITLLSLEFITRDYILPPLINQPYTAAKDVPYRPAGALFISPANEKCAYRIVDYCSGPGTWLWRDNAAGLEVLVAGGNGYE